MKSRKFYLALVIFSLVGQVAWVMENMYFNVFMYEMFNATAADISMMVAASAIAATLTTHSIKAKRQETLTLPHIRLSVLKISIKPLPKPYQAQYIKNVSPLNLRFLLK